MGKLIYTISGCIVILFSLLIIWPLSSIGQCHEDDFSALKALFESTNGNDWKNQRFWEIVVDHDMPQSDCDLSFLHGVALDSIGRVKSVELFDNNLSGQIPTDIYKLEYLTSLSLIDNNLSGELPIEIGKLGNLQSLSLSNNNISGSIPNTFYDLNNIQIILLENNNISGEVSSEIEKLSYLEWLFLNGNQLEGNIPATFKNLDKLTYLSLHNNLFNGPLPSDDLAELPDLKWLFINDNNFEGCFPESLCLLNVDTLNLANNPKLPNSGNLFNRATFCGDAIQPQIGQPCNDGNELSTNDVIKEDCSCAGEIMIAVEEQGIIEAITIFPNPAGQFLFLDLQQRSNFDHYQIISVDGKIVQNNPLTGNSNNHVVSIQFLKEGSYFIKLTGKRDNIAVTSFIKL